MVYTRNGTETSPEELEGPLPVSRFERPQIFGQARPIPIPAQQQPLVRISKKLRKERLRAYERERERREQEHQQLLQRMESHRQETLQLIQYGLRQVREEMLDQMDRMQEAWFQEPRRRPIPTPRASVIQQQQVPKAVPRSVLVEGGSQIPPPPLLSRSEPREAVSTPAFVVMSHVPLTTQQSCTSNEHQSRILTSSDTVERVEPRIGNSHIIKPNTYNGSTPWDIYERQFKLLARINNWDSLEKAAMLTASLRGPALDVLGSLSDSDAENHERICAALGLRFGEEYLSKLYFTRFEQRCRGRNEHLAALGQDLERLIRLAFPKCDVDSLDKLACAKFMDAISDSTLRYSLKMADPSSLREAIAKGLEMEALFQEDSDSIELSQNNKGHSSIQSRGNTPSKQPHPGIFASFDSYRKNRFSKICSFCEKRGHGNKHCFSLKTNIEALKIIQKRDETSWCLRPKPSRNRSPSFTAVDRSQY